MCEALYKRAFKGWLKHLDFILWDELCLFLIISYAMYLGPVSHDRFHESNPLGFVALVLGINLFLFVISDSLNNVVHRNDWQEFKSTARHSFYLLSLILIAMMVRHGEIDYPQVAIFIFALLYVALSFGTRILWRRHLFHHIRSSKSQKGMLIVTSEQFAPEVARHLREYAFSNYVARGFVLMDRDAAGEEIEGVPVVANLADAADYICREWIDEVLYFRSSQDARTQDLIERCREMAVTVHFYIPMQGVDEDKRVFERIAGYDVMTTNLNMISPYDALVKRVFDVLMGIVGSLIALIALAIIGPKIKKAAPGPLLFKQERIGENGKKFKMYKIRSMYVDADRRKLELERLNSHADGMLFKMDFDPRVIGNELLPDGTQKTGIGDFIRRTSLDELPQFFNVLRGEMSVVGTRPPTVDEWEKYQYHHRARMSVRPGVTGLWQINRGKDKMPFDEVVRLDTEYISHWSLSKDLVIIFRTVVSMVRNV